MSHEGGPESTQQRTVAELLAMYGGDTAERAPRRRRRRDDSADTGPQAIIERVNSESAKLTPIRDDQPPPRRTSHRAQRPASHHQPPAEPRSEPRPVEPRPAPPTHAAPQPPRTESRLVPPRTAPPLPPQTTQQRPVPPAPHAEARPPRAPAPPVSQPAPQPPAPKPPPPAITHSAETRPVQPPRRERRPAPPPQMPSAPFPVPDAGPQGSGYFPPPPPLPGPPVPPAPPRNGSEPEAATEQMPRIPPAGAGGTRTGQQQVPFAPARAGFGPTQAPPGTPVEPPRNGHFDDEYTEYSLDDARALEDYQEDYPDSDDVEPDDYVDDDDLGEEGTSAAKEWLIMAVQVAVSVIGGAAVWLGFNWLWGRFPQAALVAALAVIVGLVWIVRRIRRADDLQTTGLAVLVGLFVTVSPAALLLLSR